MANKEVIIGKRKKTPIALPIVTLSICAFFLPTFVLILIYEIFTGGEYASLIVLLVLFACVIMIEIFDLVTRCKTRKNDLPLAKIDEKSDEFEFYSILATPLKIKKDKIYMVKVSKAGHFQVFFYSDINQKLVFNTGYFENAKELKNELKGYLKQEIK